MYSYYSRRVDVVRIVHVGVLIDYHSGVVVRQSVDVTVLFGIIRLYNKSFTLLLPSPKDNIDSKLGQIVMNSLLHPQLLTAVILVAHVKIEPRQVEFYPVTPP